MMLDPLADILSKINNAEKVGKTQIVHNTSSKLIKEVLRVQKENGYIREYEKIENNKGGILLIKLSGKMNKCSVIKPRFSTTCERITEYESRYLPAQGFGFLILSTPKGIMTNEEAKEKKTGGVLLAYVY